MPSFGLSERRVGIYRPGRRRAKRWRQVSRGMPGVWWLGSKMFSRRDLSRCVAGSKLTARVLASVALNVFPGFSDLCPPAD